MTDTTSSSNPSNHNVRALKPMSSGSSSSKPSLAGFEIYSDWGRQNHQQAQERGGSYITTPETSDSTDGSGIYGLHHNVTMPELDVAARNMTLRRPQPRHRQQSNSVTQRQSLHGYEDALKDRQARQVQASLSPPLPPKRNSSIRRGPRERVVDSEYEAVYDTAANTSSQDPTEIANRMNPQASDSTDLSPNSHDALNDLNVRLPENNSGENSVTYAELLLPPPTNRFSPFHAGPKTSIDSGDTAESQTQKSERSGAPSTMRMWHVADDDLDGMIENTPVAEVKSTIGSIMGEVTSTISSIIDNHHPYATQRGSEIDVSSSSSIQFNNLSEAQTSSGSSEYDSGYLRIKPGATLAGTLDPRPTKRPPPPPSSMLK